MEQEIIQLTTHGKLLVYTLNTIVVGSGAAGLNAADRLVRYGQGDIALVTEGMNMGTSRNTGSDKQTYYKLTLAGDKPDSIREMAETLFSGECVDGDIALCEAALSVQGFLNLAELGVPFPRNRYGEFVGYKTDHDPRCRATSVGPYTSRSMTECLERDVRAHGVCIFDGLQAVSLLGNGQRISGLLCLDRKATAENGRAVFVAFCCTNIVWATGGPAGMYADSVYPYSQLGATGIPLAAGAVGKNLTEWQYGLASIKPRWNVSGTYMQVLPRFISTLPDGTDAHEFLYDAFAEDSALLDSVFLKGYQWPFDVRKAAHGSSRIDILVYEETKKGRRVFLDFRSNPGGGEIDFSALCAEAHAYLSRAGACFGTPLERLRHMNAPAVEFYRNAGVDLGVEPLEIALCAQHNNGGIGIDCWWQTNLSGLFCVGEAAASHGVYRPGGSALNAGQVGSMRAAQYIAARCTASPDKAAFMQALAPVLASAEAISDAQAESCTDAVALAWDAAARRMSCCGAAIRTKSALESALAQTLSDRAALPALARKAGAGDISRLFHLRDMLLCQQLYLCAMLDYLAQGGKSRGSALYHVPNEACAETAPGGYSFVPEAPDSFTAQHLQELCYTDGAAVFSWRTPRAIPEQDDFFENVWRSYRENQNIE